MMHPSLSRRTPLKQKRRKTNGTRNGPCERCRIVRVLIAHHKLRRAQGGKNDPENLAWVCTDCHREIHDHPDDAYKEGWLVRGTHARRQDS